jgi:hypothetical protein
MMTDDEEEKVQREKRMENAAKYTRKLTGTDKSFYRYCNLVLMR